jgi:hypothetical protein
MTTPLVGGPYLVLPRQSVDELFGARQVSSSSGSCGG